MDSSDPPASRPSLCTLPLESRQAILCHLQDLQTLQAAILSHPAIYSAFVDRKQFIIYQILTNAISPELLPDAIFAFSASSVEVEPWTRQKVLSIIEQYRTHKILASVKPTLKDAFAIQEMYYDIHFFTSNFISTAFSTNSNLPSHSPSFAEWCRVARNLYGFEVYRHLFRKRDSWRRRKFKPSPDFTFQEQWDIFYKDYAVWELEQLACVSEYLFRSIAVPFNEIAAHDVEWAFKGTAYSFTEAWELGSPTSIEQLLLHGVSFLKKVITAGTYEERHQLLGPYVRIASFLPDLLDLVFPCDMDDSHLFKDYDQEQASFLQVSCTVDPDPGPGEAWRWAHFELARPQFVCGLETRELRRWGYVMWDHSRLVDSGIFDSPFDIPPEPDLNEIRRRAEAVIPSMIERRKLYQRGARGWWDEGDESQLTWGLGYEPSDEEADISSFRTMIFF